MIDPNTHEAAYWKTPAFKRVYPREDPARHGVERWSDYSSFCWDFTRKAGETGWKCGEMFGGLDASSLFTCPKCAAKSDNWDGNHITGYNYNVCYLGYVENDAGKRYYPTAWGAIKNPAGVVVFGDGGYAGGPNKFMRAPMQDKQYDGSSASLRKAGTQAFRHGWGQWRHCNMAFLDGHVEEFHRPYMAGGKQGWVDKDTYSAFISSGNGIYGPRGFGVGDDFTE
jgi:prepilin-type processing-associated H-X9-DG protein